MSLDIMMNTAIVSKPPRAELHLRDEHGQCNFAQSVAIAPYRARTQFDIEPLQTYAQSAFANSKDHILALREDPSYFRNALHEYREHTLQAVPDQMGNTLPELDQNEFVANYASAVVAEAYVHAEIWKQLTTMLQAIKVFDSGAASQEKLVRAVADLSMTSQAIARALAKTLHDSICTSPTTRAYYFREYGTLELFYRRPKLNIKDPLVHPGAGQWLDIANKILTVEQQNDVLLYFALDRMDSLVRTDASVRNLLSSRVSSLLSQLSIVTASLRQITLYKQSPGLSQHFQARPSNIPKSSSFTIIDQWTLFFNNLTVPDNIDFFWRKKSSLDYPIEKPRTFNGVKKLREAESVRDSFWGYVDEHIVNMGTEEQLALLECCNEYRQVTRTAPWKDMKQDTTDVHKVTDGHKSGDSTLWHEDRGVPSKISDAVGRPALQEKVKPKTRGVAGPAIIHPPQVHDNEDGSVLQPDKLKFVVDAQTHRTLRSLFFVHSSQRVAIKWVDFMKAMTTLGFAAELLHGSVWQFTPTGYVGIERGIHFHEPHHDTTINKNMVRNFGRRLKRAYGLDADSFRLA